MRLAGIVYVAFFGLSIGATAMRSVPLQLVATASYVVLALALYRALAPVDPSIALALVPLALAGCALQAVGQVQADAGLLRLALVPFGLFLVVLAHLLLRSGAAPVALAVTLAIAGLLWPAVAIPGMPAWYGAVATIVGVISEGALAVWLVVAGGQ